MADTGAAGVADGTQLPALPGCGEIWGIGGGGIWGIGGWEGI